ncbi:MAG: endonuclease V [Planctomycetaceae bacterium]
MLGTRKKVDDIRCWPVELPDLNRELNTLLEQIPAKKVTTYGALAQALGHAPAAVWIAKTLTSGAHENGFRVIRSTGEVPQRDPGLYQQTAMLLLADGIDIDAGHVDLARYGFTDFRATQPLAKLKIYQDEIASRVDIQPLTSMPRCVAGLDLSYPTPDLAVAACVLVDYPAGNVLKTFYATQPVTFPYITGLLAFREIPALLQVVRAVLAAGDAVDVWLVDGNGILHPRGAGIAVQLGVMLGLPTVGVSKSLLCGAVDLESITPNAPQPIAHNAKVVGMGVKSQAHSRPIFVSPGNGIDVAQATEIVQRLCQDHRLPEPIYWADRLSREHG